MVSSICLGKNKQNPKLNLQEAHTVFQSHCRTKLSERSVSSDAGSGLNGLVINLMMQMEKICSHIVKRGEWDQQIWARNSNRVGSGVRNRSQALKAEFWGMLGLRSAI